MGLLPMDIDILPPSDDRIFKLLMTAQEAKPVLMDLISSIIQRPVISVEVHNNELPVSDVDEKAQRLDVNCKVDDDSQFNIEMQASRIQEDPGAEHKNLKGKGVYYMCDLHSSQPSKGLLRYDRLARTYQVTFCSYTVFPHRNEYMNSFSIRHDIDNELLTDAIRIIYVELSKLDEIIKKSASDMTELEKWAVFFQYASDPAYREKLNKVIASKEVLQMAGNLLMSVSKDEHERALFRSRRKFQTDLASNLATAEDRGRAEGRAEGKAEGRVEREIEIARNLLLMNLPVDKIASVTGLTYKEVENLHVGRFEGA